MQKSFNTRTKRKECCLLSKIIMPLHKWLGVVNGRSLVDILIHWYLLKSTYYELTMESCGKKKQI
jgi:hypothetical protein